jgi:hypothetical protein
MRPRLARSLVTLVVQVNGKLRGQIDVPVDADRNAIEQAARRTSPTCSVLSRASPIRKIVVVPGKLVNCGLLNRPSLFGRGNGLRVLSCVWISLRRSGIDCNAVAGRLRVSSCAVRLELPPELRVTYVQSQQAIGMPPGIALSRKLRLGCSRATASPSLTRSDPGDGDPHHLERRQWPAHGGRRPASISSGNTFVAYSATYEVKLANGQDSDSDRRGHQRQPHVAVRRKSGAGLRGRTGIAWWRAWRMIWPGRSSAACRPPVKLLEIVVPTSSPRICAKILAPLYLVFGEEPLQALEAADAIRAAARERGYARAGMLDGGSRL